MPTFQEMLGDRLYISQYQTDAEVGFVVHQNGVPTDADGNLVTVEMVTLDWDPDATPPTGTRLFQRQAEHPATGTYVTTLTSHEASTPGFYRVVFTYTLDGVPQVYEGIVEVGLAAPAYDALDDGMKAVIEAVLERFADLFDSPYGGPHLQVYFQTNFGRQRLANLMRSALGRLNTAAQPHTTYTLEGPPAGKQFPFAQWGALLEQALYIEVIKHLRRSYLEQPEAVGILLARHDRRDYFDRWGQLLNEEQSQFEDQFETFKIAHMGLGRPHVLVAGGVYGNYGPHRLPYSAAARPRYWSRFY